MALGGFLRYCMHRAVYRGVTRPGVLAGCLVGIALGLIVLILVGILAMLRGLPLDGQGLAGLALLALVLAPWVLALALLLVRDYRQKGS